MDGATDNAVYRTALNEARRTLAQRLAIEPRAFSTDGQTFRFVAPVAFPLAMGGYVLLRTAEGVAYLGQITEKTLIERDGPELSVEGDAGLAGEVDGFRVTQTAFRVRLHQVAGSGFLLGRQAAEEIVPPTASDVFEDATIGAAETAIVEAYLQGRARGKATLDIGTVRAGDGQGRAALLATGFDRHTFLCGQSGSGKTYGLGVVLERLLLETELRIVIVDPNSDFIRLAETRAWDEAERGFRGEHDAESYGAVRDRYLAATETVRVLRPARHGTHPPDPLRIRFSDLSPAVQGMVLQLDPLADREEFNTFRRIVERMGERPYSPASLRDAAAADLSADARQVALRIANLGVAAWDVWAEPDEPALGGLSSRDWRAMVLDVGGFAHADETSLVAMATLNYLWQRREERAPVLVVIDEAHNVCPQQPADRIQAAATELAVQIAGEGRKFGIYLLLSTQRPQKLHANVLSQCDNLLLMRMNSAADLDHLAAVFSFVPPALLTTASSFTQGEALAAGKIVPTPLPIRFGGRISPEGRSDIPADWAVAR